MTTLNNLHAEQTAIGAMMNTPELVGQIAGQLLPDDFVDAICRDLFLIIQSNSARGKDVDPLSLSVTREFLSSGEHTLSTAYEIFKHSVKTSNIDGVIAELKEKARLRKCLVAADTMARNVKSGMTSEQAIAAAQNELVDLATNSVTESRICFAREGMSEVIEHIQKRMDSGNAIDGLSTGLNDLDRVVEGLRGGMTMILAGRPASGKTTLGMNIAENVSLAGIPSLIFSLEMPRHELLMRCLSSLGRVPVKALRRGEVADHSAGITAGANKIKELPMVICDRSGMTIETIRSIARFQHRMNGIGLIVIDYLGLIRTKQTKNSTRSLELGEISRQLKEMAKELNIPVLCLHQMNREIEKSDRDPRLSDLRDSGEIEQDADIVAFTTAPTEDGVSRILIAKHRHAPTGDCALLNRFDISRFDSMPVGAVYAKPEAKTGAPVDRFLKGSRKS